MKIFKWISNAIKSVKTFFNKVGTGAGKVITSVYKNLDPISDAVIPVAVRLVEALKTVNESPIFDASMGILTTYIKGDADDILIAKARKWLTDKLPKAAFTLKIIDAINDLEGSEAQLEAIIAKIQALPDIKKESALTGLALMAAKDLADGKLDKAEKKELWGAIKGYYEKYVKK